MASVPCAGGILMSGSGSEVDWKAQPKFGPEAIPCWAVTTHCYWNSFPVTTRRVENEDLGFAVVIEEFLTWQNKHRPLSQGLISLLLKPPSTHSCQQTGSLFVLMASQLLLSGLGRLLMA
ncbi:hypothetical protein STEG23_029822, partial [Scotinomys teguina]